MEKITTVGIDLAKNVFSLHGVDGIGRVVLRKTVRRGQLVQTVAGFYRIAPAQMLVAHDEIDLPPGTVRLKQGGGHGGHNGVRDVIAQLGADFWRLRIGVGHPGSKDQVIDAVLDRASTAEQRLIDAALARAYAALPEFLRNDAQKAMKMLHTRGEPAESGES